MKSELKIFVSKIIAKHFGTEPSDIKRMSVGSCNEVFLVTLPDRKVIVRMNENEMYLKGSDIYIPLFKSKGIKVPEILANDYSKSLIPLGYQVLSKIEGTDITNVISQLTDEQLIGIASEIADIFEKLKDVPTNGSFGYIYGYQKNVFPSWLEVEENSVNEAIKRGTKTGVLDNTIEKIAISCLEKFRPYLKTVQSRFYYDDMSSKNVMIDNGVFSGLVDLDGVAYGDYLETAGRIKASWYDTHQGDVYTKAVMDKLKLNETERKNVTRYALLHRISWLCENGIQFNMNTSSTVDWKRAEEDKRIVLKLAEELGLENSG